MEYELTVFMQVVKVLPLSQPSVQKFVLQVIERCPDVLVKYLGLSFSMCSI